MQYLGEITTMSEKRKSLEEALSNYNRALDKEHIEAGKRERAEVLKRFPLTLWPTMSLEQYALGQENSDETFCRWMEFRTPHLGSIKGGSARKLIIYKHKEKPGWYFDPAYKNEQEAWTSVREAFVAAFQRAQANDWNSISDLTPLLGGPALLLKTLHTYFPDKIFPISSKEHILHFLRLFNKQEAQERAWDVVRLNRALLAAAQEISAFQGWTTNEIERFLYRWADPREQRRVVKIAPGENAKYWDECLAGGYICVGWGDVGDLREFDSKDFFRTNFEQKYAKVYNNHRPTLTKKANEVWTLRELEPGDLIVANDGTSKILGIGEVIEPGYEWSTTRNEFRHIVHVKWDTSIAKDIPPQKKWAFVTVAPVSDKLYEIIAADTQGAISPLPPVSVDPTFQEIAEALERKGQVILYGPPGTGKTYTARRFAVVWLMQQAGKIETSVLTDLNAFDAAEQELSTLQVNRRAWWMVANPKYWSWDRLFMKGRVQYSYGRLQRNYPLVQPDDLVIGYQSTPDKRIVAIARVTKGFGVHEGKEPTIELAPVTTVKDGLTYDELVDDAVLKNSEPIRFRTQGTLFALTPDEAGHIFALLTERDPNLQSFIETNTGVGPLTRLTFHPSYSYEDFIEGFRPVNTGSGALALRLEDGVFKRVCREAQAQPDKRFLVVIDEINRANVAKVFGELITLLEKDKRGMLVTLPQSKESFCIPPNVFLLGTMNTADRSIKLLDAALRRRFAFVELMPSIEMLRGAKVGTLPLDDFLEELNNRVSRFEGREKQIGHSFLLDGSEPISDPEEFSRRFRQEILPLLQEYCYDDYGRLADYLGDKLVDRETQGLDFERIKNTDALLTALEEEFGQRKVDTL